MAPPIKEHSRFNQFKLPKPVVEFLNTTVTGENGNKEKGVSSWLYDLHDILFKLAEWSLMFAIGYFGFGYGWIIFFATIFYMTASQKMTATKSTALAASISSGQTTEQSALTASAACMPAWVNFPDFDRVEWINDIIRRLWPFIARSANEIAQIFVEPEIQKILYKIQLEVAGFSFKQVSLGDVPLRLGGIKVYNRNTARDEIMLDCDIVYAGDAQVNFSLQGIGAEANDIRFKGVVRIILKPLLPCFPFIGGFQFYFLQPPQINYSLGGIAKGGDLPGISQLVRSIVADQVNNRFVWPSRFHLYFPLESVQTAPDKSFQFARPAGVLTITVIEAQDLLKADRNLMGKGSSDPYSIVSVGSQRLSFRDAYIPETLNPVWNHEASFVLEDEDVAQDLVVEVLDYDQGTSDDRLGNVSLPVKDIVDTGSGLCVDRWLNLSGVKHGRIRLSCRWSPTRPAADVTAPTRPAADVAASSTAQPKPDAQKLPDAQKSQPVVVALFLDSADMLQLSDSARGAAVKLSDTSALTGNGNGDSKRKGSRRQTTIKTPPCSKCVVTLGKRRLETRSRIKTFSPVFSESLLFLTSATPETDTVAIDVVDDKSSNTILGHAVLPVSYLLGLPKQEFFDMPWQLKNEYNVPATVTLSARIYAVVDAARVI